MSNRKLNKLEKELQELDKALAYIISLTPNPDDNIYQGKNGKKLYQKDLKAAELKFIQSNGGKFSNNKWVQSAFATNTTWRGALRPAPISTAVGDLFISSDREGINASGFSTVGGQFQGKPGLVQARNMLQKKQSQIINLLGKSEWTSKDVIPIELRQDLGIARGSSVLGKRSNEYFNREFSPEYIAARRETAGTTRNLFGRSRLNTSNFANYDSSNYGDKYRFNIRTDHFPSSSVSANSNNGTGGAVTKDIEYRNQLKSINTIKTDGGGWYGRNDNVLTADGKSTSLSINTTGKDFYGIAPGEMLGVIPKWKRDKYDLLIKGK